MNVRKTHDVVVLPPSCHDHPFRKRWRNPPKSPCFFPGWNRSCTKKLGKWKAPSNSTIDDVPIRKNGTFHGLSTAICIALFGLTGGINIINWSKPAWRFIFGELNICKRRLFVLGPQALTHFHKYPWLLIFLGLTWKGKMRSLPLRLERLSAPKERSPSRRCFGVFKVEVWKLDRRKSVNASGYCRRYHRKYGFYNYLIWCLTFQVCELGFFIHPGALFQ